LSQEQYQLEIIEGLANITAREWNDIVPADANPFLSYEFLSALEYCGCVGEGTGWQPAHLVLRKTDRSPLIAAMPLYLKQHSYGEFVFDWSWAQAYEQHGILYYPKALCAIPFTPVQGPRLLCASNEDSEGIRATLLSSLKSLVIQNELSSAHILFPDSSEIKGMLEQGFMLRDSVQFHWENHQYKDFDQFLAVLTMKRRKNIRRERAIVAAESINFTHIPGSDTSKTDWEFFYRCYENTYVEHHSSPYLTKSFFISLADTMPNNLHLIVASKDGERIACSLLIVDKTNAKAYGRYWGSIKYVDCLHFETAYYQAIEYCIRENIQVFEGGAQGEHKMARGFMPTTIHSAHWIANPQFSEAIKLFLRREHAGIAAYVDELSEHSPLKSSTLTL
jgi:predicted N-acyltransferase